MRRVALVFCLPLLGCEPKGEFGGAADSDEAETGASGSSSDPDGAADTTGSTGSASDGSSGNSGTGGGEDTGSTSTSTSGTGATGGTGTATSDAGSDTGNDTGDTGPATQEACDATFGDVEGYVFCGLASETSCNFRTTDARSCDEICEAGCVAAAWEFDGYCDANIGLPSGCQLAGNARICTCTL